MNSWILSFLRKNNILLLGILLIGCAKSRSGSYVQPIIPEPKSGLQGKIIFKEGNFNSDGEIAEDGRIYGVQREVIVFELTNLRDVEISEGDFVSYVSTNPVDTIYSDHHGSFHILDLPDGNYSLFVRENDRLYSKLGEGENFLPIYFKHDSLSKILIEIDYLANY